MDADQRPNEIAEIKNTIIECAIALLRIDPARGSFAIEHAVVLGMGQPSARIIGEDMRGYVATMIEAIRDLRTLDSNARIIAEDGIRIAMGAAFTPRKSA